MRRVDNNTFIRESNNAFLSVPVISQPHIRADRLSSLSDSETHLTQTTYARGDLVFYETTPRHFSEDETDGNTESGKAVNLRRRSHIRRGARIAFDSRLRTNHLRRKSLSSSSPSSSSPTRLRVLTMNMPYNHNNSDNKSRSMPFGIRSWSAPESPGGESNPSPSTSSVAVDSDTSSESLLSPESNYSTPTDLESPFASKSWMGLDIVDSEQQESNSRDLAMKMMDDSQSDSYFEVEDGGIWSLRRQKTSVIVELLRQRRRRAGLE